MTDGEVTLFESCAMIQHILDKYGNGQLLPPPGTNAQALDLQWCWFAESTFARSIGEIVNHGRACPDQSITAVTDEMRACSRLHAQAALENLEASSTCWEMTSPARTS